MCVRVTQKESETIKRHQSIRLQITVFRPPLRAATIVLFFYNEARIEMVARTLLLARRGVRKTIAQVVGCNNILV